MKHLYKTIFTLWIAVFACCLEGSAQKKIAIIGSSTSDCYLINTDSCYVGRLQYYYGNSAAIIKLAVSGASVFKGMPTNYAPPEAVSLETPDPAHNITAALQAHPDVVLVNYPSNGYDVYSIADVMYCLRTIKATANNAGVPCYITTTQPRSDPASFRTSAVKRKMAALKDSILQQFGTYAIDFWNGIVNPADTTIIASLGQGDGVHLNSAGHKILFDRVVAKNIIGTVLPVTLTALTAAEENTATVVRWSTAAEGDIDRYQVQQSTDGLHFTTVQEVKPANSSRGGNYSASCASPQYVFSYYRIVTVFNDGKTALSGIVKVQHGKRSLAIAKLYTNAGTLTAQIQSAVNETITIQVVSQVGQLLLKSTAALKTGVTAIPVNIQLLPKGVYFIRISGSRSAWQTGSFVRE